MEGEESGAPAASGGEKKSKLGLIIVIMLVLFGLAAGGFLFFRKQVSNITGVGSDFDVNNPPKFIQADFIDLAKIYSISKFRSGSGHDFSQGSGETCRSMKHYFAPQQTAEGFAAQNANQGMPPAPDGNGDIAIYSPVDGKISQVQKEQTPIGEQIYITPDSQPDLSVRLFHIYLDEGVKQGSTVKAGQKLGDIGRYSTTDIAITKRKLNKVTYTSYFDVMPDNIFAKYQERGVKSRDELILTKEYRDANPLQCNGEQFATNYDSDPNFGNYVRLSGYISGASSGPSTQGTPSAEELNSTSNTSTTNSSSTNSGSSGGGTGGGNGSGGGGGRQ